MKNNKGFIPILITIIILVVLVAGGYIYYTRNKNSGPETSFATQNSTNNIVGYITNDQVGLFHMGGSIPNQTLLSQAKYSIKETTIFREGDPQKQFVVSSDGKDLLTFELSPYQKIWDIRVTSPEFNTKEGIGVGSTIADFLKAYPGYEFNYSKEEGEKFMLYAPGYKSIQFFLDRSELLDPNENFNYPKFRQAQVTDFSNDAKISSVRVFYTADIFSVISPKEGDQWISGKTYPITLSSGLFSDYHVLLYSVNVIDSQGKTIGAICPPDAMRKGDLTFNWTAGKLMAGCAGTGNTEFSIPNGKYQISFTELDSNGNKIRSAKSGLFNLVAPTVSTSITVTSPKGGENWALGTTHAITWQDSGNVVPGTCTGIPNCTKQPKPYDIKLVTVGGGYAGCSLSGTCEEVRTIARSIQGFSYNWSIPNCTTGSECSSNFSIPTGSYTIQVCQIDTTNCGTSNNFSTIKP